MRLILTFVLGLLFLASPAAAQNWGRYSDPPQVELQEAGYKVRLLRDFSYTDPRGQVWTTPKDWVVDGASIPRALWSVAGGPLSGPYRDASIIHDFYCDRKTRPWREVHRTFYYGMRASGVSASEARDKYLAVYKFGPRWGEDVGSRAYDIVFGWEVPGGIRSLGFELTGEGEARWDRFAEDLADENLSLDQLEAAADRFEFRRDEIAPLAAAPSSEALWVRPQLGADSVEPWTRPRDLRALDGSVLVRPGLATSPAGE